MGFGRISAGIVGTGFMAKVHIEALRRLGVNVSGVVGSTPGRTVEQSQVLGLDRAYESYDDLLNDESIDIVHITSPNHLHYDQVLAALEAGKHVVCEKPLALTSLETEELLRAAERSGLVHAVNFMSRFYAQCQEARAIVESGQTGPIKVVSGSYLQDWLTEEADWNWRIDPVQGGKLRAVSDIGSHWLDLVTFIVGQRVSAVMADLTTVIPVRHRPDGSSSISPCEVETEDVAGILLRFDGGGRGTLAVSQVSPGRKNDLSFQLDGMKGSLAWHSERPDELWIGHRERPNEILVRDPNLMSSRGVAVSDYPGGHAQGFPDAFKALYGAVYKAVATGGPGHDPDFPTFADGHEQALIADAIARSAEQGCWIDIQRPQA